MKSLVITKVSPISSPDTIYGGGKRLDLFLSAIRSFSETIEVAYFARQDEIEALGPLAHHEAALTAAWGLPVCLNPVPTRRRAKTAWNHYGAGALSVWQQDEYFDYTGPEQSARVAESLARRPDIVLASNLLAMSAFFRAKSPVSRLFLDLENIEHKTRLRAALAPPFWPGKALYTTHVPSIFVAERRAVRMAEVTFVCSELDRRYLRRLGIGRNIEVVPNGLPIPAEPAPPAPDPTLLYLGTYGYQPNCDAADRLIRQIWPLVRAQLPEARLLIAGKGPERIASFRSAPPGVTFTGFVDDLDQLYAASRVVACPITVGGGTRLKLVEAASYGRPMVSTQIGAEGLEFEDGREILLRDDDSSFAEACILLLRDQATCTRLGEAARVKMKARYGAEDAVARIAQLMRALPFRSCVSSA